MKINIKLTKILFIFTIFLVQTVPPCSFAAAAILPDTGQTKFYNNIEEIGAPAQGEAFFGQDAHYSRARSFTKLGADGSNLTDSATVWYQIKDNVSGLIWTVKQGYISHNPLISDLTTNNTTSRTLIDDYGSDPANFIEVLNAGSGYCDHTDWRLPTINELSNLVDSGHSKSAIDQTYFSQIQSDNYWSSTPSEYVNFEYVVNFSFGNVGTVHKDLFSAYVLGVRSGSQQQSLIDNGDGTVTDPNTGLMWHNSLIFVDGDIIEQPNVCWKDALAFCEKLTLAGYDDWHLPDRNELQSLIQSLDDFFFRPVDIYHDFWSSTTFVDKTNNAWYVDFFFDDQAVSSDLKSHTHYVIAVRSVVQSGSFDNHMMTTYPYNHNEHSCSKPNKVSIFKPGEKALNWVHIKNAVQGEKVEWKWYDPEERLVFTYNYTVPFAGEGCAWCFKTIASRSGLWKVKCYYNGTYKHSDTFTVEDITSMKVLNYFSAPGNYPRGLAFDGHYLWNVDGISGRDKIYKIDMEGRIIHSIPVETLGDKAQGITYDNNCFWVADNSKNKIYKVDSSGKEIKSFNSPYSDPRGLAFDGQYLYHSDSSSEKIYKINTNGNVLKSFNAPNNGSADLAFDGKNLWCLDTVSELIYKLDVSGKILEKYDTPDFWPYGLTYDGTNLWLATSGNNRIYKLAPSGSLSSLTISPTSRNVAAEAGTTTFSVSNSGDGDMNWSAVPEDNWLTITSGSSGTNAGTITVDYEANSWISPRTGTIAVTAPGSENSPIFLQIEQRPLVVDPTITYGTTVITHGFQLLGTNVPDWVEAMAQAIVDRAKGGCIWRYDKKEGKFFLESGQANVGEQVFIFDWVAESDAPAEGYSEAAADSLFVALLYAHLVQGISLDHLHFIGHSRGTVVNSETVERLLASGEIDSVEHVTTLDPVWDGSTLLGLSNDHDVNKNNIKGDQGTVLWWGIKRADNYYSYDDCGSDIDCLDGNRLNGVYNDNNQNLTGRDLCCWPSLITWGGSKCGGSIGHSGVHIWYYGTIDIEAETDLDSLDQEGDKILDETWYGYDETWNKEHLARNKDGYNYSRIAGANIKDHDNSAGSLVNFDYEVEGIVNGNFDRGDPFETYNPYVSLIEQNLNLHPGWSLAGLPSPISGSLEYCNCKSGYLSQYNNFSISHNYFYMPPNTRKIKFWCKNINDLEGELTVSLKDMTNNLEEEILSTNCNVLSDPKVVEIEINPTKKLVSLIFAVKNHSNNGGMIQIDDVSLVIDTDTHAILNYFNDIEENEDITSFPLTDGSWIDTEGSVTGKILDGSVGLQIGTDYAANRVSKNSDYMGDAAQNFVTVVLAEPAVTARFSLADFNGRTTVTAYDAKGMAIKTLSVSGSAPKTYTITGIRAIDHVGISSDSGWLGSVGYTRYDIYAGSKIVRSSSGCEMPDSCFSTIREAYVAADYGEEIKIEQGDYEENLTFNRSKIVTLTGGWNNDFTLIDGASMCNSLEITAGCIEIDNFTIGRSVQNFASILKLQ